MSEWQPISTAPKDGRTLLLFTTHVADEYLDETFSRVQTGRWDEGSNHPDPMWRRAAGWETQIIGEPSHWMPMPAPPTAKDRPPHP